MADLKCPNCGCPCASGEGGKVICAQCGGSFVWNGPEPKLTAVGEIDKLRDTVSKHDADLEELKKRLPASSSGGQPPEDPSRRPDPPFDDDDDDDEDEDEEDL